MKCHSLSPFTSPLGGIAAALCLAVMSCSEQPNSVVPSDDASSAVSEPAAVAQKPSIVGAGETKETARVWSDAVNGQLAALAQALVDSGEAVVLSDSFQATSLTGLQEATMFEDASVVVREFETANANALVLQTASEFLGSLRELLRVGAETTVKFKLYGIHEEGAHLKTRQRLMTHDTLIDAYAVVDATWEIGSEEEPPRLLRFALPKLVQSTLNDPSAAFKDIASSILGGNAAWSEQLQLGMNTWVRHLDRSLSPDFLGYHGVAIGDVTGDDLEDVYLCQPGGLPNLLFRQQDDGTLLDISKEARVDWLDNSTGALLVDLDNDGDRDLAVATRTAFLIMENNGTGRFTLRERLTSLPLGYSPTAADYDLDGDLDLLVLRYTGDGGKTGDFPTPHPFHSARNGGANVLLQNQGDFGFANVTDETGLGVENYRFSFAASWEDFDNDGDIDLYIANDFGPNQLFRNEGGAFLDESSTSDTQDWGFGMSASWGDYDRDGAMDLYVSSMFSSAGNQIVAQADFNPSMPEETRRKYLKMVRGNTLMRNMGDGIFADATNPIAEGFAGWAWGSSFGDFNNDGWEDLYVANGYISQPDMDDL